MGSCAGISVYSPALTDFIFMVNKKSEMFITGPKVVQAVTGEKLSKQELGGAEMHCKISGVADNRYKSEEELLDAIRELMSFLPQNADEQPPMIDLVLGTVIVVSTLLGLLRGFVGILVGTLSWLLAGVAAFLLGSSAAVRLAGGGRPGMADYLGGYALTFLR